jgi:bacillithiol biosynthesis cysteine-adding enzyme BshC
VIQFEPTRLATIPELDWKELARERAVPIDARLRPAFVAGGPARENLERLLGGALCITTGQQPGLFLGPLFTLYKALSAAELARAAEATIGQPVVPVFWVAGDDHDFAEANHCFVVDGPGDLQKIELRQRDNAAPLTPLYRERLGPEVEVALDRLRSLLPEGELRQPALDWLGRHYRPPADFATAFAGALAEILAPHGVVVFLAHHPAAKTVMAPLIKRAISDGADLDRALALRAGELRSAGREVPVSVGDGATPVMVEGKLGRDRLVARDGRFVTRRAGEAWAPAEILALVDRESERFSPNVLLRPVVEAAILPTLAYAGGPGELRYLAQADPLYQHFGVRPQARVPRWSGRVLEARVRRSLEKWGITAGQLETDGARLEADLIKDEMPSAALAAFRSLRDELERSYTTIAGAAAEVDPTLQKPVESARNSALGGLADIEKKMISHLKKKNEVVTGQFARARNSLFPQNEGQERVIATVSFIARYGEPFVTDAAAEILQWSRSLEPVPRQP